MVPDGWQLKRLRDMGRSMIGLTYSPEAVVEHGGTLVLRSSNIRDGEIVYEDTVFVSGPIPDSVRTAQGDILICSRNGSRDLIGKSALIDRKAAGHAFGAFMAVYRSRWAPYLFQVFQTPLFKRQVDRHLGATINQVTAKSLGSFAFPMPPQAEMEAIAALLAEWDIALRLVRRVLHVKRRMKRGLMQQMLTGRLRFPEFLGNPWRDVAIGDVLTEVTRPVTLQPESTYRLVSIRRRSGGFFDREIRRGVDIGYQTLERLEAGDFVIARRQVLHGAMAIVPPECDGAYVSNAYAILRPRDTSLLHLPFFNYLSQQQRLYHMAFRCSYGVAIEKMLFRLDWFFRERLLIPPTIEEQSKIVSVFETADAEIDRLRQLLCLLKEQKKGLMQRLLTGQVRVPASILKEATRA